MSTKTPVVENDTERRIDPSRFERACTETMTVRDHGPGQYLVGHRGEQRVVDVETGTCECDDYQYRGHSVFCKHVLRACIHHLFRSAPNTRLVARVARFARDADCPYDVRGCAGPTTLGARGYPCPGCVAATSSGDWTVWQALVGRDR